MMSATADDREPDMVAEKCSGDACPSPSSAPAEGFLDSSEQSVRVHKQGLPTLKQS